MSGFVSELMVFTGFVTDEVYTLPFRIVMASLAAIGVILTPIYLLSMLREIFFGKENPKLSKNENLLMQNRGKFILLPVYFYRLLE